MSLNVFGQLRVKEGSFIHKPNAVMDDKQDHYDGNDEPMALIKISTENINETERGRLAFRATNRSAQVQKKSLNGQIWLYISTSADELEITHPDYSLIKYKLPETLCGFCTYEMVVQYVPIISQVQEEAKPQNSYLTIVADQPDAFIFIDDQPVGQKETAKLFPIGSTHTWRVDCDLYHSESGSITITGEENKVDVKLRPAYGYLNITSSPENGAFVFVNNKQVGTTPYTSDRLASGTYNVRVMKEMYNMVEKNVVVTDGKTTKENLDMSATFVDVMIKTDANSDIYVDDELKGKGSWTGRLSDGAHLIEAKKAAHKTTRKEINLALGVAQTITIDAPKPIYGFLEISSSPLSADIYIDGKNVGKTPKVISDVLEGTHELRLEKQGCASLTKTITIKQGETLTLNESLQTGKEITITTDKAGDKIYVDGDYVGESPLNYNISYGTHEVKAERDDKKTAKTIDVQGSGKIECNLKFNAEIEGHEYVDLGLPSGVKWATCNVGSLTPEQYGLQYSWSKTDEGKIYTYGKESAPADISGNVSYDAATNNWGGSWRMPTEAEMDELLDKCTWEHVVRNDVHGYLGVGPNGNSIFLPLGWYWGSTGSYRTLTHRNGTRERKWMAISIRAIYEPEALWNHCNNTCYVRPVIKPTEEELRNEEIFSTGKDYFRKEDYVKALEYFHKIDHKGAQKYIGDCYYEGLGVEQDYAEAVKWYGKSAYSRYGTHCGNADAQMMLGVCYFEGKGVDKDYEKSFKLIEKSAKKGQKDAQCNFGYLYYKGLGVNQNYGNAAYWYRMSADQGFADAQYWLGICHLHGRGVEQNYTEALKWFEKSAEQDYAASQHMMGLMYYRGWAVTQNYTEAVRWFQLSAEQGYVVAQYDLGYSYYQGYGVEQDYAEAVYWYRKSAEQGYAYAQNNLGWCYYNGNGVGKDYAEAVKWYNKAADNGDVNAMDNLGDCYYNGEGVSQDYAEAIKWYNKAVEKGSAYAQCRLGDCYLYGNGVVKDKSMAKKYYKQALDNGYDEAKDRLKKM